MGLGQFPILLKLLREGCLWSECTVTITSLHKIHPASDLTFLSLPNWIWVESSSRLPPKPSECMKTLVAIITKPCPLPFDPCQVTKKRVSTNKKSQETREFYSAAQTVANNQSQQAQNQPSTQSHVQNQPSSQQQSSTPDQSLPSATRPPPSNPSPTDTVSTTKTGAPPQTPPRQNAPATGHTPSSASKRRHRKLAVNFEAAKVTE